MNTKPANSQVRPVMIYKQSKHTRKQDKKETPVLFSQALFPPVALRKFEVTIYGIAK